jgi:hypothetical protein
MTQPSADITSYVDLRVFDVSDQDMVNTALANLRLNLPGWTPREGNTESLVIESLALEIAELIVAINRIPGAVVEAIITMAGVSRDFGQPPDATATITFGDTLGHTLPAGTRIYLPLSDGTTVTFLVEPPGLTVAPGSSTGTASLIGDTFTASANGMPIGTALVLADPLPFVDSIVLLTAVADGRDAETDNSWRDRGVEELSRLSSALATPRQFVAYTLAQAGVSAALALDLYNPSGGGVPGDNPGYMTVAVLGPNGTTLSSGAKTAIQVAMQAQAVAILQVAVIDATIVTVAVATKVVPIAGATFATVSTAVQTAVQAYLNPLNWSTGATIYLNEMISLIDQVAGVDRVVNVTLATVAADYTISGIAALPKAGVITVTQGP